MKCILISGALMLLMFSTAAYAQSVEHIFRGLDEFVNQLGSEESALFATSTGNSSAVSSANNSSGSSANSSGANNSIANNSGSSSSVSTGTSADAAISKEINLATEAQKQIALLALAQLGKKYHFGAAGPDQFDCSGLIYHVFTQAGKTVPRTSQKQGEAGVLVDKSQLKVGDLVFFDTRSTTNLNDIKIHEEDTLSLFAGEASSNSFSPSKVTHSGIYIGEGKFIHASSGAVMKVVVEELESKYFAQRFLFAKSYL